VTSDWIKITDQNEANLKVRVNNPADSIIGASLYLDPLKGVEAFATFNIPAGTSNLRDFNRRLVSTTPQKSK